nr:MAG TPA: hypothetical protein [Caudoviricetes sp.]
MLEHGRAAMKKLPRCWNTGGVDKRLALAGSSHT